MKIKKYDIHWEGSQFINHSLALVNREICKRLISENTFDIGIIPYETNPDFIINDELQPIKTRYVEDGSRATVTIRHQWPPNFKVPNSDMWVLFQPWEFGAIPRQWYIPMKYWIDEIWVYSSYNKECYVRSGIPEDKIHVIQLGVDEHEFHADVKPIDLNTNKSFHFLFVGGTISRKGIDILLQAYLDEFTDDDDVCLVIKDHSFYKRMTAEEYIKLAQSNPQNPKISYINHDISTEELAGLYKACDCLVHPYRGEGFGLPIIEAMACGKPVIVPSLGPSQDYCNEGNAFIISSEEEKLKVKKIDQLGTVDYPWWLKMDKTELQKTMRFVYENRELVKQKGQKASQDVISRFTWDHSARSVADRLTVLLNRERKSKTNEQTIISEEVQIGMKLFQNQLFDESLNVFLRVLDVYPHSVSARYNAGIVCLQKKDFKQALVHFMLLSRIIQNESKTFQAEIHTFIGICFTSLKQYRLAIDSFKKGTTLDPTSVAIPFTYYRVMIKDLERQKQSLDILAEIYHQLGLIYFEFGNHFRAEELYVKALNIKSDQKEFQQSIEKVRERIKQTADKYLSRNSDAKLNATGFVQKTDYEILWQSPIFNASGYAEEQIDFLKAVRPYPLKVKVVPHEDQPKPELLQLETRTYLYNVMVTQLSHPLIHFQAGPAYQFSTPRAPISIGRTMFETNSLPVGWADKMNELTEIWVPSEFNRETFANAGVEASRIYVMPAPLAEEKYPIHEITPYPLGNVKSFKFLSVFDWSLRKGWDILIRAYFEEFHFNDDVSLVLKVYKQLFPHANPQSDILQIARKLGLNKTPHIQVIESYFNDEDLIRLYAAVDAFVLPSRGEGWGRPYMEAMAMGLPTIGTRWSGQLAFMNEKNSYLVDIERLVPIDQSMPFFYHGHKWAQPSIDHLKQLMRNVYENRDQAKQIGQMAREELLAKFSKQVVGKQVYQRMDELVKRYYE